MECSFDELDALAAALGLDLVQFPFKITSSVRSRADRERQFAAAGASLSARGLISGASFDPVLERSLRVLAARTWSVTALGDSLVAVAAFDTESGVVAVQRDESLALHPVEPDEAVFSLVSLLPELPPGPGDPIVVPDDLARRRSETDFADHRFTSAVRATSVRFSAEELLRRPRLGGGAFRATTAKRELGTVSWLDVDLGRFAILKGSGHSVWLPASRTSLAAHVHQLFSPEED